MDIGDLYNTDQTFSAKICAFGAKKLTKEKGEKENALRFKFRRSHRNRAVLYTGEKRIFSPHPEKKTKPEKLP